MKLSCVLTLLILIGSTARAAEAQELVFYTEPPTTYLNALEVVSLVPSNVAFATAVLPNGHREEISRAGIVAIVALPPRLPAVVSAIEANESVQKIRSLEERYPQYRAKLDAVLTAWNTALAYAKQNAASKGGEVKSPKAGPDLEVDGVRYHDVALLSFDGGQVGISDADGAATVPAIHLSPAQIAMLNGTSTTVRIDPAKIVSREPRSVPDRDTGTPPKVDNANSPGMVPTVASQVADNIPRDLPTDTAELQNSLQQWTQKVEELKSAVSTADKAAEKAFLDAHQNTPESLRLNGIAHAERQKLKSATEFLGRLQQRVGEIERKARADKLQMEDAERQRVAAEKMDEAKKQFQALPAVTDTFVEPKLPAAYDPPTFAETMEFINTHIAQPRSEVGFGEQLQKFICRDDLYVFVFDPADLNPDVKYSTGGGPNSRNSIRLESRNHKPLIECWHRGQPEVKMDSWFTIPTGDDIDTEKMAKAFSHLILMFGGKKEAF